jgi:hypothetical protein
MSNIANATSTTATTSALNGLMGNLGLAPNQTESAQTTSAPEVEVHAVEATSKTAGKKETKVEHGPEFIATKTAVDALVTEYQRLKVEVFDRSDRALWQLLSNLYDIALTINKSKAKKELKAEMIKVIKARGEKIATSAETEAVVVRYVFVDVARQTRNNYAIVMQKALAEGIEEGGLFGFLEQHKGIVNVVEHNFDTDSTETAAAVKEAHKAQRKEAGQLAQRLFTAKAHTQLKATLKTDEVFDWNLTAEQLAELKDTEKVQAKNQRGNFVFFVAVPAAADGTYNVVQGFAAPRDFEESLLVQIAARMQVPNEHLKEVVHEFEDAALAGQNAQAQVEAVAA